jgi:TonB family protein
MPNTATKTIPGIATSQADSPEARRPTKRALLLITTDDSLWPQIGGGLGAEYQLKQVDSIDELRSLTPAGQAAIVVWDARGEDAPAGALSRLQLHSTRYAIIAIAHSEAAGTWEPCVARGQIVAFVPTPLDAASLGEAVALAAADSGAHAQPRAESGAAVPTPPVPGLRKRWLIPAAVGAALLTIAAIAYLALDSGTRELTPTPPVRANVGSQAAPAPAAASAPNTGTDVRVFQLLESAEQAMRERHYIDPAAGSALALYRQALVFDPNNGEAHQGMQRLAEVLFSRVDSALDEHKFDVALQSLETARSIEPDDARLAAFDARIANMRSEFGPGQIQAAIAAQAFDRALQLIDEAVRARALTELKAASLRDEVSTLRKEAQIDNLLKLIDARLQQDRLTEPRTDSASYYLDQARRAGADAAMLQPRAQELARRERQLAVPVAPAAPPPKPEPSYVDLIQTRLSQGKLLEPDNDNAFYYLGQLTAKDPQNAGLATLQNQVQTQIIARAAGEFDAGRIDNAKSLLRSAATLGASPQWNALNDRISAAPRGGVSYQPVPEVDSAVLHAAKPTSPQYPPEALAAGTEGWVDLSFVVAADGKVGNITVLGAEPPHVFDRAARDALARTRYAPVMQNGRAIAVTSKIRVTFRLADR